VAGTTFHIVVSTDEGLRSATSKLLIEDAEPLVIAGGANAIWKKWSTLEFTEGRRENVLQR
jgi:hypothetical protein